MNSKTLLALVAVTAALVLVAISVSTSTQKTVASGARLLPDLRSSLNEISQISIVGKGGTTVATLDRGDKQWTLAERAAYPVDLGRLRQMLISLADAIIVEEKTSIPEYYDRLGVEDIEQNDAAGHRIDLHSAGQTISVIIGNSSGGTSTYVRLAGKATSWLVSGSIELDDDPVSWLVRDLVDIPSTNIASVTITHPDGELLRVIQKSPDEPGFEVLDVPEGRDLSYEGVSDPISRVLSSLIFDDVASATELESGDIKPIITRFETFEGLVIEVLSYRTSDTSRVHFRAFVSGTAADNKTVSADAEVLSVRLAPWIYTLPEYQADQLVSRMDDLLLPTIDK